MLASGLPWLTLLMHAQRLLAPQHRLLRHLHRPQHVQQRRHPTRVQNTLEARTPVVLQHRTHVHLVSTAAIAVTMAVVASPVIQRFDGDNLVPRCAQVHLLHLTLTNDDSMPQHVDQPWDSVLEQELKNVRDRARRAE